MRPALHVRKARIRYPYASIRELTALLNKKRNYKGLSYQRVYQLLVEQGLETTPHRLQKAKYCKYFDCSNTVESTKTFCASRHRFQHYNIKLKCGYCGLLFYRKRARIIAEKRKGAKNAYCTIKCFRKDNMIESDGAYED
jgi:hypothetical protein